MNPRVQKRNSLESLSRVSVRRPRARIRHPPAASPPEIPSGNEGVIVCEEPVVRRGLRRLVHAGPVGQTRSGAKVAEDPRCGGQNGEEGKEIFPARRQWAIWIRSNVVRCKPLAPPPSPGHPIGEQRLRQHVKAACFVAPQEKLLLLEKIRARRRVAVHFKKASGPIQVG